MEHTINQPLVSVYTCVYNGASTIHRVFESMKNITYPNIEHLIINDGSTDDTEKMVLEYINSVNYPVRYFKKENGGKHSALNIAWENAQGYFMIQLDADDELLPHSISFLVDTYFSIPEEIRENYWCVHGRCVTQFGEFVGTPYPDGINSLHWKSAGDVASKCVGEKIGLQVTKYLSEYKFPSVVGVSYIPEIIVWRQLNLKYGTWYTNEVVRTYYVNEGGNLSAKRTKRHQYGPLAFYHKWRLTHPDQFARSAKDFIYYSIIYFVSSYKYRKNNPYFKDIKSWVDKILLALLVPVTLPMSWIFRLLKHIK